MRPLAFILIACALIIACNDVDYGRIETLSIERVKLVDDSYYYQVHRPGCKYHHTIWRRKDDIDDFEKLIYYGYCPFCFTPEEVVYIDNLSKLTMGKEKLKYNNDQEATYEDGSRIRLFDFTSHGYDPLYVRNGGEYYEYNPRVHREK